MLGFYYLIIDITIMYLIIYFLITDIIFVNIVVNDIIVQFQYISSYIWCVCVYSRLMYEDGLPVKWRHIFVSECAVQ